ncbi:hotdog fold domain-containing protein [Spongisporangium articulatum]|uniref:Hotdog fold domain-containing protein n=1 Tax=Spongisporangium articulatum TaxID=3362603 RepID=A0ABW8AMM9_9ACTN
MVDVLPLYRRLSWLPGGRRLFSWGYARAAPYFRTISPYVARLEPHRADVVMADRKAVHNHIGTVHAIALCNGLEAAMGALAEATVPTGMRWLPKGMTVEYLAPARGPVTCIARTTGADWAGAPDVPVAVEAVLDDGTVAVRGTIRLWVTPRR